jgi:hypothetical protein
MQLSKDELAKLICRKAVDLDTARHQIDLRLKNVYWAIDGVRTFGDIAAEDRYEPAELIDIIEELIGMGLVEIAHPNGKAMDPAFLDFLSDVLSMELGPMGNILLDDALGSLGFVKNNFPEGRLPQLIDCLVLEIAGVGKAEFFKNTVAEELQRRKKKQ